MVSGRGGLRVEPEKPKTLSWEMVGEGRSQGCGRGLGVAKEENR